MESQKEALNAKISNSCCSSEDHIMQIITINMSMLSWSRANKIAINLYRLLAWRMPFTVSSLSTRVHRKNTLPRARFLHLKLNSEHSTVCLGSIFNWVSKYDISFIWSEVIRYFACIDLQNHRKWHLICRNFLGN